MELTLQKSKTYTLYLDNHLNASGSDFDDDMTVKEVIKGTLNYDICGEEEERAEVEEERAEVAEELNISDKKSISDKKLTDETCSEENVREKRCCDVKLLYPCLDGDFRAKWLRCTKGGTHKLLFDNDMNIKVWEIRGRAITNVYGLTPRNSLTSLHMKLPVLFLLIKYAIPNFFLEIKILDSHQFHRRYRFSSFHKAACVDIFSTKIPIVLFKGWNIVQINLARLTSDVYRTRFLEAKSIQVHANVRIGRVAFMSRQLLDDEIPTHNSWFSPKRNNPVRSPGLVSIYSQQSGQVIDYNNIYEATF